MKRRLLFLLGLAAVAASGGPSAQAATVAPGAPVDFVFNVAGDVPVAFDAYSYSCLSSCFHGSDLIADNLLASGASFALQFGSGLGMGDFGTAFGGNDHGAPAFNLGGALWQLPLPNAPSDVSILVHDVSSLF